MKTINDHLEELFKECEHGDEQHRQWLKDKFNDYLRRNPDWMNLKDNPPP